MTSSHVNSVRFSVFVAVISAVLFTAGCKDSLKTTVVSGGDGDLSNPSIQPQVVFTLPSSGSTGPFKVFNLGDGVALPSFVIQFNKLMSTYSIQTGTIICSGFDKPVRIALHSQSAYPVYKMGKVAAYDDVLEFAGGIVFLLLFCYFLHGAVSFVLIYFVI